MRLQQILSNLLGNAVKFTSHGHVALRIAAKQHDGTKVRLSFAVEDTGIGMSTGDLTKLFQPFSQADTSITRRFGGTGLGLAISHDLLALMGGEFVVESAPNQGATFSFEILFDIADQVGERTVRRRAAHEPGALKNQLETKGSQLHGSRILVAEDNRINQQVVKEFLKLSGIEVVIANNGQEAIELLQTQHFDAVLMDVSMPIMDGIEATGLIRQQSQFLQLPIIALTAGVTQKERDNCLASGMNDFVTKPVNPEELLTALNKWVNPGNSRTDAIAID
jgi:CheY-like chemotaxis protein